MIAIHWRTAVLATLYGLAASLAHGQPTTTIITHGFSIDSKGAWVQGMAEAIVARAGEGSIYRYTGGSGAWTYVPSAVADGSSDVIVLIFNWVPESDGPTTGPNQYYAQAAGDALYAMLRGPRFTGAPNPAGLPPDLISDRAMHFIGHSRGACVNSEAARRLAIDNIPVDQITTLDPHPVNGTLDAPYNYNWGDPVPQKWSNVAWADNYWRADGGGLFNGLDFDGITIANAFNVQLNEMDLNCCAYRFAHLDVHLWHHGTIDLAPNPCDGEQCISNQMRQTWWPGGYTQQGFYYSVLGGGSAARPGQPAGIDPGTLNPIMGGAFDQASYAGWLHHGGSVAGQVVTEAGNGYLRLGSGSASAAVHNRFFLHEDAAALVFDYRVQSAAAGEQLEAALIDQDNIVYPLGAVALDSPGGWIQGHIMPISAGVPRSRTYRLDLRIAGAAPIDAVAGLDNLAITFQPLLPGDVTGDGCVNVDDLLAVINAWGACPPSAPGRGAGGEGCPADINADGIVNVDDLLVVINGWGPCS